MWGMMTRQKIILLVWLLVAGLGMSAQSRADESSYETYAVYLINQIRQDPLGYAEGLGYNRETLVSQQPWISDLADGMGLVTMTDFLAQQADARNSEDESALGPEVTINTNYAVTGDVDGVVSFLNFMDPKTAIAVVINTQLKRELDPDFEGRRLLLSEDISLVGVSFRGGKVQTTSGYRNAFYIYACLSSSLLKSEVQVVNMINQVRANPRNAGVYLALDLGFLPGGYGPLFFHGALEAAAKTALSDDSNVAGVAVGAGFPTEILGYTNAVGSFPTAASDTLAQWIFSLLMVNEVAGYPSRDVIFSPSWNRVGAGLFAASSSVGNALKLTVVSGQADQTQGKARIYGVAFVDADQNQVLTPGEEAPDRQINVYNSLTGDRVGTTWSNKAGQFSFSLPVNVEYNVETVNNDIRSGQLLVLTRDAYLGLAINE